MVANGSGITLRCVHKLDTFMIREQTKIMNNHNEGNTVLCEVLENFPLKHLKVVLIAKIFH